MELSLGKDNLDYPENSINSKVYTSIRKKWRNWIIGNTWLGGVDENKRVHINVVDSGMRYAAKITRSETIAAIRSGKLKIKGINKHE